MSIVDFLLARIAEDEAAARDVVPSEWGFDVTADRRFEAYNDHVEVGVARVLAECEAKRRIVELHESWPVLVESPPTFEQSGGDINSMTYRASQQIAWLTTQEYRAKFGDEPPTSPILRALAAVYVEHQDYDQSWRVS